VAARLSACRRVALGRQRGGGRRNCEGGDEFAFDLAAGLAREDVLKGLALIGQYGVVCRICSNLTP
jgi:hypothetical protein